MSSLKIRVLSFLACRLFRALSYVVKIKSINYPEVPQFIVALWHAHQCVLYNIKNPGMLNVLISQSNDGEIVAKATEAMGIKTVRGSRGRKGAEATLKLIEKLEFEYEATLRNECFKAGKAENLYIFSKFNPAL